MLPKLLPKMLSDFVLELLPKMLPEMLPKMLPEMLPKMLPEMLPEMLPKFAQKFSVRKTKRNQFRADFRATLMRGGICGVDRGQFWAVLASCGVGRVSIGTNITRNTSVEHPHNEEIPIWSTTMYHASRALRHLLDVNHLGHNQLKFSRSPIQSFASNGGRTDPFPMSMETSVAHVISA